MDAHIVRLEYEIETDSHKVISFEDRRENLPHGQATLICESVGDFIITLY